MARHIKEGILKDDKTPTTIIISYESKLILNECHKHGLNIHICETQNSFSSPLINLRSFSKFVQKPGSIRLIV